MADLIRAAGLDAATLRQIYGEVWRASGLSPTGQPPGIAAAGEGASLAAAITHLAGAWYREYEPIKVPLAEFVARVAALAPDAGDLNTWLRTELRGPAAEVDLETFIATMDLGQTEAGQGLAPPRGYLAIVLHPRDANLETGYSVEIRLVDD